MGRMTEELEQELYRKIRDPEYNTIEDWHFISFGIAEAKGWHDQERTFGEEVSLMHSELSEALESYRERGDVVYTVDQGKPEGIGIELADLVIRVLDFCAKENIDLETLLKIKCNYNLGREYRHGDKLL